MTAPSPKKTTPKRGRPRTHAYIPFEEARAFIREELIPSKSKYEEWWDQNKPKTIPRYPYRAYGKEWTSWNDFLGTNNKFRDTKAVKWRPFEDAVKWAHTLGLKKMDEWKDFCKREGMLPDDIPQRPDLTYSTWQGWGYWLGNKPVEAVRAQQEIAAKTNVFYVIRDQGSPMNVLTVGIEKQGLSAIKRRWEDEKFDILRLYWYDVRAANHVRHVLEGLSTPYLGEERLRLVPNVSELLYHIELFLEYVTPADVSR